MISHGFNFVRTDSHSTMAHVRPVFRAAVLGVVLGVMPASCCSTRAIQPGFAGMPELNRRSDDLLLPLGTQAREHLLAFMGANGDRAILAESGADAGARRLAADRFRRALDRLEQGPAPLEADLKDGSRFLDLFEGGRLITVHDARVGKDAGGFVGLGPGTIVGVIAGGWVFAFSQRPLELVPHPDVSVSAWRLGAEAQTGGRPVYGGLTVFSGTYARIEAAQ